MVHHYEEETEVVDLTILPHPDYEEREDRPEPPPLQRQEATKTPPGTPPPSMEQCPLFEPFALPPMPMPMETSIRELSYALFASFFLGVTVAGTIAFFSRRAIDDA